MPASIHTDIKSPISSFKRLGTANGSSAVREWKERMRLVAMKAKAVAIRLHATLKLVRRVSLKAITAAASWKAIALPMISVRIISESFDCCRSLSIPDVN
jgi:hypothetical protein